MAGPILTNLTYPIIFPAYFCDKEVTHTSIFQASHFEKVDQNQLDIEEGDDMFFDCEDENSELIAPSKPEKLASRVMIDRQSIVFEDEDSEYEDAVESFEEIDAANDVEVMQELASDPPIWIRCADKVIDVVQDVMESDTAMQLNAFSQTAIGHKLVQVSKAFVGQKVGMIVGAAFPEASMGFAVGKALASKMVSDPKKQSMIVQGAGILAGLTATTLTTSLSYFTGTPMEYSWAFGYMMQAGGTIAGGMNGLEVVGQEVHASYIPRAAASLIAADIVGETVAAVNSVTNFLPLPTSVSTTIAVAGGILNTVSGSAGYNALEIVQFASNKDALGEETLAKPVEFLNRVVVEAGGSKAIAAGIANRINLTAVKDLVYEEKQENLGIEANKLITEIMAGVIDSKVGATAIVRAVNSFTKLVKNKDIQDDIEKLNACTDIHQKQRLRQVLKKKLILNVLKDAYGEKEGIHANKLCDALMNKFKLEAHLNGILDLLAPIMQEMENDFFGTQVYSEKTKDLIDILAPVFFLLLPIHASQQRQKPTELSESENTDFYNNVADLVFTVLIPRQETLPAGLKWMTKEALIWKVANNEGFLANIAVKMGNKLKEMLKIQPALQGPQPEQKLPDPANIFKTAITQVAGSPQAFSKVALKALELKPVIEKLAGMIMDKTFIDTTIGINAIVRALNSYVNLIQDSNIQDEIKKLKECKDSDKKKALKVAIGRMITSSIRTKYGTVEGYAINIMQRLSASQLDKMIDKIVITFKKKEKQFLGELTSLEAHKDLLDVCLPPLLPLIAIYATQGLKDNPELTEKELEAFYGNIESIVFSPYQEYRLVKDLHKLVDGSISMVLRNTTFIADILSKLVEDALVSLTTKIIEIEPKKENERTHSRFRNILS